MDPLEENGFYIQTILTEAATVGALKEKVFLEISVPGSLF